MSAYAVPGVRGAVTGTTPSNALPKCGRRQPSLTSSLTSQFIKGRILLAPANRATYATRKSPWYFNVHCNGTEHLATTTTERDPSVKDWKEQLVPGVVVELWSQGELRFGLVESQYDKGVVVRVVRVESGKSECCPDAKVSFGEVISVWDSPISPRGTNTLERLTEDVERGLQFLKLSRPRSLDLLPVYDEMRRVSKNDPRAMLSSTEIGAMLFHGVRRGSREKEAAVTAACAILVAADAVRFKRAGPGKGWRALPGSVVTSRRRCSFVDTCKGILEHRSSGVKKRPVAWSREQLEILRDLEVFAASGTAAKGTAATALDALGYESTDDGAAQLLLDIEYWATGTPVAYGKGENPERRYEDYMSTGVMGEDVFSEANRGESNAKPVSRGGRDGQGQKTQRVRGWTFPAEILAEARELQRTALQRRLGYTANNSGAQSMIRRNLFKMSTGEPLRAYCIDDKTSRFLDDALSVEVIEGVARIAIHVTDMDEVVKSGSPIDELARERGQSLYLPLKPLHMLPAAVMEAACFNASTPAEAITVLIDFQMETGVICNWEVFPSILPPVKRLNYDQFNNILEGHTDSSELDSEDCENLSLVGRIAPMLAEKLDQRRPNRKQKPNGFRINDNSSFGNADFEPKGVAAVRITKRNDRTKKGTVKVAQVVDFRESGGHAVVADMLVCAGALLRQFARENRAHLPEDKGASAYVARCGTAPMRRYADLATQRQIKCILFGRQPAGRRRMDDLRFWLAKRQSAAERTVAERRRSALYDSLSDHCAQQTTVGGSPFAVVQGHTRGISVTKKGRLKVEVDLPGTGLSTVAVVNGTILKRIEAFRSREERQPETGSAAERLLADARALLPPRSKVKVHIHDVNTVSHKIDASVVDILGMVSTT